MPDKLSRAEQFWTTFIGKADAGDVFLDLSGCLKAEDFKAMGKDIRLIEVSGEILRLVAPADANPDCLLKFDLSSPDLVKDILNRLVERLQAENVHRLFVNPAQSGVNPEFLKQALQHANIEFVEVKLQSANAADDYISPEDEEEVARWLEELGYI